MNNKEQNGFYGDVDRARYRANWSCLVWFFCLAVVVGVVAWLLARHYGLT